ncbi:MAG: phage tail assembly chaperone [Maricaulaceae bacterium]
MSCAVDWPGLLRAALALGLAPEAFWRLALREWRALTDAREVAPLSAERLADLRAAYPDAPHSGRGP